MGQAQSGPGITQRLGAVHDAKTKKDLAQAYDSWSSDYDRDMESFGNINKILVAGMMGRHVGTDGVEILDAGCGTGFMGEVLHLMGYRSIVGIDISQGMLGIARERGVYRELWTMALGEPLSFADDCFAATLAIGVLAVAHAPAHSIDELIRVTIPGGILVFNLTERAYEHHGFKEKLSAMDAAGRWTRKDEAGQYRVPGASGEADVTLSRMFVYKKIG